MNRVVITPQKCRGLVTRFLGRNQSLPRPGYEITLIPPMAFPTPYEGLVVSNYGGQYEMRGVEPRDRVVAEAPPGSVVEILSDSLHWLVGGKRPRRIGGGPCATYRITGNAAIGGYKVAYKNYRQGRAELHPLRPVRFVHPEEVADHEYVF